MVMNEGEVECKVPKCETMDECIPDSRYHELEERIKKFEGRIVELEAEIATLNCEYDELKVKYKVLEGEKLVVVSELDALKAREAEVKERAEAAKEVQGTGVDLTKIEVENNDDDDELFQLKAENLTLEHEKKKAENEAQVWKQMYHELKSSLGKSFEEGMTAEDGATRSNHGTPSSILQSQYKSSIGGHRSEGIGSKKARRSLFIEEEEKPTGKMAPSTPIDPKPSCPGIINLDDSDDEPDVIKAEMDVNHDKEKAKICSSRRIIVDETEKPPECCLEDDDMDVGLSSTPRATTSKRKRAANMVTSDSESDDDDIPLCKWKAKRFSKVSSDANGLSKTESPAKNDDDVRDSVTPRRRRLRRMSQCEQTINEQHATTESTGVPKTKEDVEDITSEEEGSECSGDSMKEFIVESSSDVSDGSDGFHGDDASDSSEEADCNSQMHNILSKLRRSKDQKFKWELEGDMLADFGKDSELCMRAVCVLYRQQTADEKSSREALYTNGRGFNKFDAYRGSEIGGFLTGGDPLGDMVKSVEELEAHDYKGVEKCRELAFKYAKQVFQIYQNKEDPFFSPDLDNK
ncbi:hypothetical protein LINPERPRIM_LOCUS11855 [Linum perenne]